MDQYVLPNRLSVVLIPWDAPAATIAVGVRGGSRADPFAVKTGKRFTRQGLNHFIEHVAFRATKQYPTWEAFVTRLDGISSTYNAYTDKSTVLFCVETDRRHVRGALEMLSHVARYPLLTKDNIERERERIRQECREYDDTPEEGVSLKLDENMFTADGLGHPVLGTEETVRRITVDQLRAYHRRVFVGQQMVVTVAGGFDPELIKPVIRRLFGSIRLGHRPDPVTLDYRSLTGSIQLSRKPTKQAHVILGWPTPGINTPERIVMGMIRNILSGRTSSRLKLRLDSVGHGYSLSDFYFCYRDIGQYHIYCPMSVDHVVEALRIIGQQIRDLRTNPIPSAELELTKTNLAISARARFGEPWEAASFTARQALNAGRYRPLRSYLHDMRAVSRRRIRQVAEDVLDPKRLTVVIHGSVNNLRHRKIRQLLGY